MLILRERVILLVLVGLMVGMVSCRTFRSGGRNSADSSAALQSEGGREWRGTDPRGGNPVVKEAMEWIGTPYAYGRSEKGVGTDCSGLVLEVYLKATGMKLPRNSARQADFCDSISPEGLRAGDLVFFATGKDTTKISHVGIMIDGVEFVHASTKKGVVVSRRDTPYYLRTFRKAGRIPKGV